MTSKSRKNEANWVEDRKHWRIDVQANGKRKSFYSTTPGRRGRIECGQKADEWLENFGDVGLLNPRLETLWADHLANVKRTTGSSNYIKTEQIGRLYLLPKLKLKRIGSITMQDWQDCITEAHEQGLSKKTCENIRGAITCLYKYARKNRVSMERPEYLTIPRDAKVGERKILQPDQLKTLFSIDYIIHYGKQVPCWFIHAWRFDVLTGLRRGELAGLQWSDIDGNTLHIARSINSSNEETRGKNDNARRYLVLSSRMHGVLEHQRAMLKRSGIISPWVFPDEQGDRVNPDILYKRWVPYRKQNGIDCSIHELRHTMISLVKVDLPEVLLKQVVGHSESMDTGIYEHRVDGEAERAASIINSVFDRLLGP